MQVSVKSKCGYGARSVLLMLVHYLRRFAASDSGATAIEYGLIASILAIALIPVLMNTSTGVASLYTRVQEYFDAVS